MVKHNEEPTVDNREIGFKSIWEGMAPEQKTELADKLVTSKAHLSHIAHGVRLTAPHTAMRYAEVLREMGYKASRADLRPDLW